MFALVGSSKNKVLSKANICLSMKMTVFWDVGMVNRIVDDAASTS
jgi:hypothetical protein